MITSAAFSISFAFNQGGHYNMLRRKLAIMADPGKAMQYNESDNRVQRAIYAMMALTVVVAIALLVIEFATKFRWSHLAAGVCLSSLCTLATFMIVCSYLKLSSYFVNFTNSKGEQLIDTNGQRKMNRIVIL